MTFFLPLEVATPLPSSPSFLLPSAEPAGHLNRVIKTILKARRIAVVCGAGISVQAGIPDFRSSDGLFQSLKRDNPALASGRDLFDASVFNAEDTTALFCQMIAQLSELSESAEPTPFHRLLRALDDRGKLLRVYTQNIDALESKSGLTFGVPKPTGARSKPKGVPSTPMSSPPRPSSPAVDVPRVIPLHGTLETLHCVSCTHAYPLRDHLALLNSGIPPHCPECTALEETRQLVGKRSRGVGKLRPSVVLYNEVHKNGEQVGEAVRKDLVGNSKGKGRKRSGADLLLVVGTSLRVPGTKRIVREFSKAVRSWSSASASEGSLPTPTPSPRRSPESTDEESPVTSIYLNFEFPVPTREWEGVFDVWVKGDAQDFAKTLKMEMDKETKAKEAALERKRIKDEMERRKAVSSKKRKAQEPTPSRSARAKKRKVQGPPSPISPLTKRKITIVSGDARTTVRLASSSDDDEDSARPHPKVYLRIPARQIPRRPPSMEPFDVFIETAVASLPYMTEQPIHHLPPTPTPSPVPLQKKLSRKRKIGVGGKKHGSDKPRLKAKFAADAKRVKGAKQSVVPPSPEVVRNAQYGLRKRGDD